MHRHIGSVDVFTISIAYVILKHFQFVIFGLAFLSYLFRIFCCCCFAAWFNKVEITHLANVFRPDLAEAQKMWICSNCSLIKWIHQIAHKNSSQCAFYSAFYAHGLRVIHPMKNVNDKIDCTHHRCTSTPYIVLMQKQ